jgi:YesN/AraC family two-component response regulator
MMDKDSNKGRVLIADDDDAFRIATQAFLGRQGFTCETAKDGPTAIEMLRASEFDLLISDINMPGNSGLELIEKLPEISSALPVILLTGYPSVKSAARSVRLQVVAYLVKPCDAEDLISIAGEAIANYRAYRAINANRQRLENWTRDLEQVEKVIRNSPVGSNVSVTETYLNLTLTNILSLLLDLKRFTEALTGQPDQNIAVERVALHQALRETIDVLERTKQSFKSKELGELRRRLEHLLDLPPVNKAALPASEATPA